MTYDLDLHPNKRLMARFVDSVADRLEWMQKTQYPDALSYEHANVLGHALRADTLIVGEAVTPRLPKRFPHWPFYGDDHRVSSMTYLNQALQKMAFDERRAMWTNALSPDPQLGPLASLAAARGWRVVALGRVAENELRKIGCVADRYVPHPQHARRFNYHRDYSKILKEALG